MVQAKGQYDATYRLGNTTVHIVAPPPMTEQQIENILAGYDRIFWCWWESLTAKDQMRINNELEKAR